MTDLIISTKVINDEPVLVVDSRLVALELEVGHSDWMRNVIRKYQIEVEQDFGIIRFENGESSKPGRPEAFAFLTEDQALTYTTYSKNTEPVRNAKRKLVKNFSLAKKMLSQQSHPTPEPRRLAPQRDIIDYLEAAKSIGIDQDPILKSLFSQRIAEQIGGSVGPASKALPVVLTVRASQLGISSSDIGTGSQLGKYVVANGFSPVGKTQHGKYEVNCYEPSEDLDTTILEFFGDAE